MCGIGGLLYRSPQRSVTPEVLPRLAAALAHRGPEDEGFYHRSGVGLVHRRLAIIDLATGRQPLGNEDDSIQVVCNGEIYNYRQLRAELIQRGHQFRTQSDTEVLVHLYEEQGLGFTDRLRGMFALALWDSPKRRLVLVRDRIGLKPLYYYRDAEKLLFASELKALRAVPGLRFTVDPTALEDYLAWGMVPGEKSIFIEVKKLRPGYRLVLEPDHFDAQPQCWWQFQVQPDYGPSLQQWQERLEAKLVETVDMHRAADVPVGAFLSGGLDSSVIVGLQARLDPQPVRTFTIDFPEARFSESVYARQAAQHFHTQHREHMVTAEAAEALDVLVRVYDEPFADPSALPTLLLCRLARQEVKVALSGDGGDEAFGGYQRYVHDLWEARWRRRLPSWFRRMVLGPLGRVWPKADWLPRPLRWKTTLQNLALDPAPAYAHTLLLCRQPWRRRLLQPLADELADYQPEQPLLRTFAQAPAHDPLAGMMAVDVQWLLPDQFLTKVDRASMAVALEVRPPMVDHELLELAGQIPSELKIRNGQTKWIFRRTFERLLPAGLVDRSKQGFDLPVDAWLRGPLQERFQESVLRPGAKVQQWLSARTMEELFTAHQRSLGRHGAVLWALLVLATWAETI